MEGDPAAGPARAKEKIPQHTYLKTDLCIALIIFIWSEKFSEQQEKNRKKVAGGGGQVGVE